MDTENLSQITPVFSEILEDEARGENPLKQLKDLLQKTKGKENLELLCNEFHGVVEQWSKSDQFLQALNLILEAIVMADDEKNEALIALYWYYVYLCEYQIVDEISNFITSLEVDYTVSFSWPWVRTEKMQSRYSRILAIKSIVSEDKNEREQAIDRLSAKMETYSVRMLVPLIIYSRAMGDIENESWLLRFVWKKIDTEGIIIRLSQVCGYEIPEEVASFNYETRGRWVTNRLKSCDRVIRGNEVDDDDIWSVKKLYTIQPYNSQVILALIHISVSSDDVDIERMLEHSVNGIGSSTAYISMGRFLMAALNVGSLNATLIVLKRIAKIKQYETILYALDNIDFHKLRKNRNSRKSITMCLDFYDEVTPIRERNEHRAFSLRDKYDGVNYDREIYLKMQASYKEDLEVTRLYDKKDYDSIMKYLSKGTNVSITKVKMVLKIAIELRSPTRIIPAYELLASIDPVEASFYNSEVEPFFIMVRKHEKPNWTSNSLVSRMWGNPLKFIEAIDRRTAIMAIPVKEVDASE